MMAVTLEPAGPAHVEVLSALHGRCFPVAWKPETFTELMALTGYFGCIAVDEMGEPIGFVLARTIVGEAEILTIGVVPEARGRGIGRQLLTGAIDRAARGGALKMFLEVASGNRAAKQLYEQMGFAIVGKRRNYYPDQGAGGDDALVMRRDIAA